MDKLTLVKSETGEIMVQENKVLVYNSEDATLYHAELSDEIKAHFNIQDIRETTANEEADNTTWGHNSSLSECLVTDDSSKKSWSREATMSLLTLLKEKENEFKSTTIKNDTVYKEISQSLEKTGFQYTTRQVKDKCKYMKLRYMKKKDNMKTTGSEAIHCEFFDELDEIFGKKPNVTPVAIASSQKAIQIEEQVEEKDILKESTSTNRVEETRKRKRKKENEDDIERRHQERLAVQRAAIESYENMMKKLIDKL